VERVYYDVDSLAYCVSLSATQLKHIEDDIDSEDNFYVSCMTDYIEVDADVDVVDMFNERR